MHVVTDHIASIGGGIELSPQHFKPIRINAASPLFSQIRTLKRTVKKGTIAKSGNWIRNSNAESTLKPDMLPGISWTSTKATRANVKLSNNNNEWQSSVSVNGSEDMVSANKGQSTFQVSHSLFQKKFTVRVSSDGKKYVFSK